MRRFLTGSVVSLKLQKFVRVRAGVTVTPAPQPLGRLVDAIFRILAIRPV